MMVPMNGTTISHYLNASQLAELPAFESVEFLPKAFEDSTNQLWQVSWLNAGKLEKGVLKLCPLSNVSRSPFWQGMQRLFELRYPQEIEAYPEVYRLLESWSVLSIPKLHLAQSGGPEYASVLLTQKLEGDALVSSQVNADMAADLGSHLGRLHQQSSKSYGSLFAAGLDAQGWGQRVHSVITELAQQQAVSLQPYEKQLDQFKRIDRASKEGFVPIMPDLRWDQFLSKSGRLHALVDLDAMVWGRRELELVLLEYLLETDWVEVFAISYQRYLQLPDLSEVRTVYRLLLFLMGVLGEFSLEKWMAVPESFALLQTKSLSSP